MHTGRVGYSSVLVSTVHKQLIHTRSYVWFDWNAFQLTASLTSDSVKTLLGVLYLWSPLTPYILLTGFSLTLSIVISTRVEFGFFPHLAYPQ